MDWRWYLSEVIQKLNTEWKRVQETEQLQQLKWMQQAGKVFTVMFYLQLFLTFKDSEKESFRKHCGKRRKFSKPAFSPFPYNIFYPSKKKDQFLGYIYFSSADAFNLE